jgi:hypothetical protein
MNHSKGFLFRQQPVKNWSGQIIIFRYHFAAILIQYEKINEGTEAVVTMFAELLLDMQSQIELEIYL